jgi:signal-transduction protein with cAMP-binding, CBS, and nucleotidyltransferase domain
LVEVAWRIVQPILDAWSAHPPTDFPNYVAGSWGPRAGYELIERDGRHWYEVINREALDRVPLFKGSDPLFQHQVTLALQPRAVSAGEVIVRKGDTGSEMYLISRGAVEVLDGTSQVKATLHEGDCFGEVALLLSGPRIATVRAKTPCDLFVLDQADFRRILKDHPQFAQAVEQIARERYHTSVALEQRPPA